MARPGILDEFKQREICAIVAVGGSRRTAAKYVGCDPSTIRRTAEREQAFADRLKRAESDLEVIHLSNIQQAAKKSWHASAWVLERVYPERYAKRAPRTIPADKLDEFVASVVDILNEEFEDSPACPRAIERLHAYAAAIGKTNGTNGA